MTEVLKKGFIGEKIIVLPRKALKNFFKNNTCQNLYLTDIGYFPLALHHKREREKGCGEYILIYCIEGKGTIILKNQRHDLLPNSFFIIEPNTFHTYYADQKDPWSIYWVHFNGSYAPELFRRFQKLQANKPVLIPFENRRINEFDEIIDLFSLGFNGDIFEYSSLLLHKYLASFVFYRITSEKKTNTHNDEVVNEIILFLKSKINDTITIEMVSKKFHKSPTTIYTIFKAKTGHSIIHHTNLLKIQAACEMFHLTDTSMKEISYSLNFQDPLYFSRLFKKYMGVSPREYRKNI